MSGSSPQLPDGWRWSTLAELADVVGGLAKGKQRPAKSRLRSVPYLRVANVQRGHIDLTEVKTIEATDIEVQDLRLLPGDVLLNEGGDRDKLGRGWVWKGQLPECIHQNHVFRARIRGAALLPELLSHYANSAGQHYFAAQGKQTTNLASISLGRLRGLPVPVPPVDQQVALLAVIESHFSRLDAATASLERVQRNLERYRSSVLKAAVEGRLVQTEAELAKKEGRSYEPASVLLKRILAERRRRWEDAELAKLKAKGKPPTDDRWKSRYDEPAAPDTDGLPELPEGWCWTRIDTAGRVQLGRQRSPEHHTGSHMRPYLRVANVFEDRIDISDVMYMNFSPEEFEGYRLRFGDILLNEGQSPHLVGRPAMYRDELPGACFTNSLVRFQAAAEVDPRFALIVFLAQLHMRRFMRIAQITTNIAHLGAGRFAAIEFPLPPLAEQRRIADEVERLLPTAGAVRVGIKNELDRLACLRQSILRWAFEGRLTPHGNKPIEEGSKYS